MIIKTNINTNSLQITESALAPGQVNYWLTTWMLVDVINTEIFLNLNSYSCYVVQSIVDYSVTKYYE